MPCNMMQGAAGDMAHAAAQDANRRVAQLEEALCGLCQMLSETKDPKLKKKLHPQLQSWFDAHKQKPGCQAGKRMRGVTWHAGAKMWLARITHGGKNIELGYFKSEMEAGMAYDAAAKQYHGPDAILNFG